MKKILMIIAGILLFLPSTVFAENSEALNLIDTLKMAEITPSITDYKETDEQITLYLFWWTGCGHCHDELEFINSLLGEYKDKIKLRGYEIQGEGNSELRSKVGAFFDVDGGGVPLLVVGESTFYGFPERYKEQIKAAIDTEYAKAERYDLFKEMETKEKYDGSKNNNNNEEKKENKSNVGLYLFAGVIVIGIFGFLLFTVMKDQKK